ncbi:hypothetical protein O1C79_003821 [Vibrio cholerae]|nr:hypothetical protein [Vibrio cholerae]
MKEATGSYKSIGTILPYFGYECEDYWHLNYKLRCTKNTFDYYWDVKDKYLLFSWDKDENGIPLYLGSDGLKYYSSIFLGHYALGAFQVYLDDDCQSAKEEFIRIAEWFVENINDKGVWINHYPMKTFGLKKSWQSCLSQAKGISVLCRAYYLTRDDKFLNTLLLASKSYLVPVSDGGVLINFQDFKMFEEYATETPSGVLNGHIFAIWSIFDIFKLSDLLNLKFPHKAELENIYNGVCDSLANNLFRWDTGYWSRYDIWDRHYNLASLFYHDLHIKQLSILYGMTGNYKFKAFKDRWANYRDNPLYRFASLLGKVYFRLIKNA